MQKTVLIIDDEEPTLEMFSLMLEAYGYKVLAARDGEEGLAAFERDAPDIVLTDIKMPGMDGIEVLRQIKERDPRAEVIVITGHGDMDLAIRALNLDATDFINKPIQRQTLSQALKRAEERLALAQSRMNEVEVSTYGGAAIISIKGNLTSQSEAFLLSAYKEAVALGKDRILLHFDDSASINGAGIAILTHILLDAREQGRDMALAGLSENFKKVFTIVGITELVNLYDTDEEALAAR